MIARRPPAAAAGLAAVEAWFRARGWKPFPFQRATWAAFLAGESGLVHAPTGTGKTLAALLGTAIEAFGDGPVAIAPATRVVWLTPLRALARDTAEALTQAFAGLGLPWTVELRTGDSTASVRRRQRQRLPTVLVTTPESLSQLLTWPDTAGHLADLRLAVVDEWHELLGSKRGVQAELVLARLRTCAPALRTWGLSATVGDLDAALATLTGPRGGGRLIDAGRGKRVEVTTLLPALQGRFPWAGHLGLRLLPEVLAAVAGARATLLFVNTRAQAELWFSAIAAVRPEWEASMGLHHGSLGRELRDAVEEGLARGRLRLAVCTSSLDLGVDFAPVEQVIQVGSPKGVGRLLQRAGRSGHRPDAPSRVLGVPTNAFELIEFAAARRAIAAGAIESRPALTLALDVLAQHVVTVALGGGFVPAELLAEVRSTHAFAALDDVAWEWTLAFVRHGGAALGAYPQFAKVVEEGGRLVVADPAIARLHRQSLGTIASDQGMEVRWLRGGRLGTVEEAFIARLRPGARFLFAGRVLELVRIREGTAWVRRGRGDPRVTPQWLGSRMPLSSHLAAGVLALLAEARAGRYEEPELAAIRPLLELQARWSRLPGPDELLIEATTVRKAHQVTLFPFAGRLAHEGLGALIAWRLTRLAPLSITVVVNDYGIGLVASGPLPVEVETWRRLLAPGDLLADLLACVDAGQLARRRFRDIARIAGLVVTGHSGARRPVRHLQASAELFFDVFTEHDPGNLLLEQARREVLAGQLEYERLRRALERTSALALAVVATPRLTPLAFPLWAESAHARLSSETWRERVQRMAAILETQAGLGTR